MAEGDRQTSEDVIVDVPFIVELMVVGVNSDQDPPHTVSIIGN